MHRLVKACVAAGLLGFVADAFGRAEPRRPEDVRRPPERAADGRLFERVEEIKRRIEELRRELERLHVGQREPPRPAERLPGRRPEEGRRPADDPFGGRMEELRRRAQEAAHEAIEKALRRPEGRPGEDRRGAEHPGPLVRRFFLEHRGAGEGHPLMPRLFGAPLRAPLPPPAPRADERRPLEHEVRPPVREGRLDDLRRMVDEARRLLDRIERELSELSRPGPGAPPRGPAFEFRRGEVPGRRVL